MTVCVPAYERLDTTGVCMEDTRSGVHKHAPLLARSAATHLEWPVGRAQKLTSNEDHIRLIITQDLLSLVRLINHANSTSGDACTGQSRHAMSRG